MAKLGTEENPVIIRVQTPEKAEEMNAICNEHGWQFIVGIEPDKTEDISDVKKLLAYQFTTVPKQKVGRNDPCPCGSGKKYKKCCINKETNEIILNENASSIGEMEPLYNRLPELAEKETRTAFVMPGEKLPAGMYSMFESFCNDKKCDCRRVFINVEHNGKILATIGYGWETNKFYKEWLGDDELVKHMKGPVLELTGAHTNMSNDLLEFFEETMLMDITFLNRLESHYEAFKKSL